MQKNCKVEKKESFFPLSLSHLHVLWHYSESLVCVCVCVCVRACVRSVCVCDRRVKNNQHFLQHQTKKVQIVSSHPFIVAPLLPFALQKSFSYQFNFSNFPLFLFVTFPTKKDKNNRTKITSKKYLCTDVYSMRDYIVDSKPELRPRVNLSCPYLFFSKFC